MFHLKENIATFNFFRMSLIICVEKFSVLQSIRRNNIRINIFRYDRTFFWYDEIGVLEISVNFIQFFKHCLRFILTKQMWPLSFGRYIRTRKAKRILFLQYSFAFPTFMRIAVIFDRTHTKNIRQGIFHFLENTNFFIRIV